MVSLASIANTQLPGLTRRRVNIPYNQMLVSKIPAARDVEQTRLTDLYRREALNQDQTQFEKDQALKQQIANTQNDQAGKASVIQGVNTALTLGSATKDVWYPAVKSVGGKAIDTIFGPSAEQATKIAAEKAAAAAAEQTAAAATEAAATGLGGATGLEGAAADMYSGIDVGATAGTIPAAGGTSIGGVVSAVAPVLAIIAAAEMARGQWGGSGTPWEEKTKQQKTVDSPATAGAFPGLVLAGEDTPLGQVYTGLSAGERTVMAPIDYLFGDSDAFDGKTLQTAGNFLYAPLGDSSSGWAKAGNFVLNPIAGVVDLFCFVAGTPITMADGSIKPVEEIDLLEDCAGGGIVTGKGVTLSDNIYDYEGVGVTGSHAVYEDGVWIRVSDSKKGKYIDRKEFTKVYIINNMKHQLRVNDVIFADYGEVTDSEEMTAQGRLDYLNANCKL
jgi:hypothetical protein